jgi:hypothetical protein
VNNRQTLLGWALIAAGFAAIAGAWTGVQSTPVVAVQLSYMTSGGLAGLGLILVGTGLLRADDQRSIRLGVEELRDRMDDLEHDLSDTKDWLQTLEIKRIQALAAHEVVIADGAGSALHS